MSLQNSSDLPRPHISTHVMLDAENLQADDGGRENDSVSKVNTWASSGSENKSPYP